MICDSCKTIINTGAEYYTSSQTITRNVLGNIQQAILKEATTNLCQDCFMRDGLKSVMKKIKSRKKGY